MIKALAFATLLASVAALGGCGPSTREYQSDLSTAGSSFEGGLGRDTYGTQRRMDVYGAATAPTLPTIGAPGFGK